MSEYVITLRANDQLSNAANTAFARLNDALKSASAIGQTAANQINKGFASANTQTSLFSNALQNANHSARNLSGSIKTTEQAANQITDAFVDIARGGSAINGTAQILTASGRAANLFGINLTKVIPLLGVLSAVSRSLQQAGGVSKVLIQSGNAAQYFASRTGLLKNISPILNQANASAKRIGINFAALQPYANQAVSGVDKLVQALAGLDGNKSQIVLPAIDASSTSSLSTINNLISETENRLSSLSRLLNAFGVNLGASLANVGENLSFAFLEQVGEDIESSLLKTSATSKNVFSRMGASATLFSNSMLSTYLEVDDYITGIATSFQDMASVANEALSGMVTALNSQSDDLQIAAGLEKQLDVIQSVSGATGDEMSAVAAKARELGSSTKYTATEAAEGFEILARSGQSASDSISSISPVLELASGQSLDLAQASTFVTDSLSIFGLKAAESGRVADVLSKGASLANTTVAELGLALQYSGGQARSMGIGFERTVAILDSLAVAGLRGEKAGTALRSILAQLDDPASKARQELRSLGVDTNDFSTAIGAMAQAGDSGKAAIRAFGVEAGPALYGFIEQAVQGLQSGASSIDEFEAKLSNATGSAAASAQVAGANYVGAISSMNSAWEGLVETAQSPFLAPLTGYVQIFTSGLQSLTSGLSALQEKFPITTGLIYETLASLGFLATALTAVAVVGMAFAKVMAMAMLRNFIGNVLQASIGLNTYSAAMNKATGSGRALAISTALATRGIVLMGTAVTGMVRAFLPFIAIATAVDMVSRLIELNGQATQAANEYNNSLSELNRLMDERSSLGFDTNDLGKLDTAQLQAYKQNLQDTAATATQAAAELQVSNATFTNFLKDLVGINVEVQGVDELSTQAHAAQAELARVTAQLNQIANTPVSQQELFDRTLIKDGVQDFEAYYQSLQKIHTARADSAIDQVTQSLESFKDSLGSNADPQALIAATGQATQQILAIEAGKAAKQTEFAERVYLTKAQAIQKNAADEQGNTLSTAQQAEQLKQVSQELAQARIANSQQVYDATASALEKAKSDYQNYAGQVKSLEQGIQAEQARQQDVVRNMRRDGMTDSGAYYDRQRELVELNAQFEQAMQSQNYTEAEAIARKREQLSQELAQAAQAAGQSESSAQAESLREVESAHTQINTALQAQKAEAEAAATAQQQQVDTLSAALSTVGESLQALQSDELDLQLNVYAADLETQVEEVKQRLRAQDFQIAMGIDAEAINDSLSALNTNQQILLFDADLTQIEQTLAQLPPAEVEVNPKVIWSQGGGYSDTLDPAQAIEKTLMVNPNTGAVEAAIARLKQPTESTHTIKVQEQGGGTTPGFAGGGFIQGPGTATSDSILARLSRGEYVLRAAAVRHWGVSTLNRLNRLQLPSLPQFPALPRFADGGFVGAGAAEPASNPFSGMQPVVINVGGKQVRGMFEDADMVNTLVNALEGGR